MPMLRTVGGQLAAVAWAALLAAVIAGVATGLWSALLVANLALGPVAVPWAVPAMALALGLLWRYLGGWGWPRRTAAARRAALRAAAVPPDVLAWALAAGALALAALVGVWIVLVELTGAGGNPTIPGAGYPRLTVALALGMGSLVSPLGEEAGFRGYAQGLLERRFPAAAAIACSSALFALWHGPTQGFAWSKLLFYFLVGVTFGALAYLTRSVLPAIPVHIAGDLVFFFAVWPRDGARPLLRRDGPDAGFWLALALALACAGLALLAFRQLARQAGPRPPRAEAVAAVTRG